MLEVDPAAKVLFHNLVRASTVRRGNGCQMPTAFRAEAENTVGSRRIARRMRELGIFGKPAGLRRSLRAAERRQNHSRIPLCTETKC